MADKDSNPFGISLWGRQPRREPRLDVRGTANQQAGNARGTNYARPSLLDRGLALSPEFAKAPERTGAGQLQFSKANISVNPASKLTPSKLTSLLKNPSLPETFRNGVSLGKTPRVIYLPTDTAEENGREWMHDLSLIEDRWEITDARLIIELQSGQSGIIIGQLLEQRLQSGSFGGEPQEERGRIRRVGKEVIILRPNYDWTNNEPNKEGGLMGGLTVPNAAMARSDPMIQIATLHSKRGLVIVATEVVVRKNDRKSNLQELKLPPIPVPEILIVRNLVHELSAHASQFTRGEPAEHDSSDTERNTAQIDKMIKWRESKAWQTFEKELRKRIELTARTIQ